MKPELLTKPALIGCSHGTSSQAGRKAIAQLLADVRQAEPSLQVSEAFVDVQEPEVDEVVTRAVQHRDAVVVPLLLSTGFHLQVDIARAIQSCAGDDAAAGAAVAAPALGPDQRLVSILADRLADAGTQAGDAVVVAAAGSSVARAAADVEQVAAALRQVHDGPVSIGYGAKATPSVADAVSAAREALAPGRKVVAASYLLAPGFFHDRVAQAGADVVTEPLAPDERLAQIVLDRYANAARDLHGRRVAAGADVATFT